LPLYHKVSEDGMEGVQVHSKQSFPATLLLLLAFGVCAEAQTSEAYLSEEAPDPNFQQVVFTVYCTGAVWMPLPENYIEVYQGLFVDGSLRDQRWEVGFGYVPIATQTSATIDRTDVRVECDQTSNWTSESVQRIYTRRHPYDLLNMPESEVFTFYELGNYNRYRIYQVKDNYRTDYTYSGTSVTESYDIPQQTNGCNLSIEVGPTISLNNQGRFYDNYGTRGQKIPACSVAPNCTTASTQTINVENGYIFMTAVEWSCNGVTVNR
jgi:hypothetical protein